MFVFATTETCRIPDVIKAIGPRERREMSLERDYFEAYKGSLSSVISQARRDLAWAPDSPGRMEPYHVRVARRVLKHLGAEAHEV